MNLSGQLRIILLLVGAAILYAIYFFGKRRAADAAPNPKAWLADPESDDEMEFVAAADEPMLDEDELDTPTYMRKQPHQEVQFDDAADEFHDEAVTVVAAEPAPISYPGRLAASHPVSHSVHAEPELIHTQSIEPVFAQDESERFAMGDMHLDAPVDEPVMFTEPEIEAVSSWSESDEPTIPAVSVVVEAPAATLRVSEPVPTLSEAASPPTLTASAPRPRSGDEKTSSPASRRKIIALRLAMPQRVPGVQLQTLLQSERLEHGRFGIFHRLQGTGTVFSLASMVEPGTFDIELMAQQQFPGVTLFMLLPGPLDGLIAYDQMLSCAQRLAQATAGILQDERGNSMTAQVMERLREEVLDFQHLMGTLSGSTLPGSTLSGSR